MKTKIILSVINLLAIYYLIAIGGAAVFQDKIKATPQEVCSHIIVAPLAAWLVTVFVILTIFAIKNDNERNDKRRFDD